jgi:hypothetical protein
MTFMRSKHSSFGRLAALAATLFTTACSTMGGGRSPSPEPLATGPDTVAPGVLADRKYVVVDVEHNELRVMDGPRVLWRAPVGTGTGFRLSTRSGRQWRFSTPSGTMQVQFKQLDPPWFRPDWWYIENRLPVPPADSPARRQEGGLGAAAVFLGNELAIHGTDKPELLGRRVSHGCIRLSNANAIRLFHNVQIGTPVVIVGQAPVLDEEQPDSVARFTQRSARRPPRPADPLARVATATLLARLDAQLLADDDSAWAATAHALVERGLRDDATALRGVLSRAEVPQGSRAREYATFLADAFSRGALRATVSLNRIAPEARTAAATAIVEATLGLWHGELGAMAPWPTRRVPRERLGPEGQAGWTALQEAEAAYRHRFTGRGSLPAGRR